MHGRTAQVTIFYEFAHPPLGMCKLVIVADGNFPFVFVCNGNQALGLLRVDSKGFLHIDVASRLQTHLPSSKWLCGGVVIWTTSGWAVSNIRSTLL